MRNYPNAGDIVRIKDSREIVKVKALWKPYRVLLEDNRIFYLSGIEPYDFMDEIAVNLWDMLDIEDEGY